MKSQNKKLQVTSDKEHFIKKERTGPVHGAISSACKRAGPMAPHPLELGKAQKTAA
jgi:hypothetical protein